ncbi:WD40 repeat domain-containing protein [Dictyobacter arantiisoli]|uniref:Anaphase-promoting complex subunit 4-like WD40 domain-containing protein n=1 Tax=Dictyobacter arantiisoli TaxID=2014874 RepID=A0A5A5TII7_9CHLR|nr:PD40 domain-containing protein [Dictyobacter arantiisoli]GCF11018.1 hypothetical protein KDI_45820 [Dictyobacter arantiisoli]
MASGRSAHIHRENVYALRAALFVAVLLPVLIVGFLLAQSPVFSGQEVAVGKTIFTYQPPSRQGITAIAWSPDGTHIASGGADVQIWDAKTGAHSLIVKDATVSGTSVNAVGWSSDSKLLAIGGSDMGIWNAQTGQKKLSYQPPVQHSSPVGTLAVHALKWSPDNTMIATAYTYRYTKANSRNATVVEGVDVWQVSNGAHLFTYHVARGMVTSLVWSPDGLRIAIGGTENTLSAWDATTGKNVVNYAVSGRVTAVDWSPNGMYLVSAANSLDIWAIGTSRKPIGILEGTSGAKAKTVADTLVKWSPDGKYIASVDTVIHVWNSSSGADVLDYANHQNPIKSLDWSPDSTDIASSDVPPVGDPNSTSRVDVWRAQ